jgi:electron transport complex protein RnfB
MALSTHPRVRPDADRNDPSPEVIKAIDAVDRLLPQTQCTQCGFGGCRPYAEAIVREGAAINRCPPGGASGIATLAAHTGQPVLPLDPDVGIEAPRRVARIVAELCIGCTHCIVACPVDAIVGAPKRMHAVLVELCTGCDLCVPPCPVDCIEMIAPPAPLAGWQRSDADAARDRFLRRTDRLVRDEHIERARRADKGRQHLVELDASPQDADTLRKRAVIEAALARARARLARPA